MHPTRIASALALMLCAVAAEAGAASEGTKRQEPLPAWFLGVWKREWMRLAGVTDTTVTVRFLQTPTMFGDVRIPAGRSRLSGATSFADLTEQDLAILAEQRGFFGTTTVEGNIATWHHEIDYQPPDGTADVGRLERVGASGLCEHALDESYLEYWWSLARGDDRYLVVRVTKPDRGVQRLDRVLLVAGDHFVYARNRAKDLPPARSLTDLIANSHAPLEAIRGFLDCELSYGQVRGAAAAWEIVHSTLPWREGRHLDFVDEITTDGAGRLSAPAAPGETWTFPTNTMQPEDLKALFPARRD